MHFLSVANFIAFLVNFYLAVFSFTRKKLNLMKLSAGLIFLCFAIWEFGETFIRNPDVSYEKVSFYSKIYMIGWCFFPAPALIFSIEFSKITIPYKKIFYPLMFLPASFFLVLQFNGKIITGYKPAVYGYSAIWSGEVQDYAYFVYSLSFVVVGLVIIFRHIRGSVVSRSKKIQGGIILISTLIALIVGAFSNFILPRLGFVQVPPIASVSVLIWSLGMVVAVVKEGLYELSLGATAENIIDSISDGLFLLDSDFNIVGANEMAEHMLGYDKKELVNKSMKDIVAIDDGAGETTGVSPWKKFSNVDEVRGYECELRNRDGRGIPASLSWKVLKNEKGNAGGYVCLLRDITERKRMEKEMRELTFRDPLTGLFNRRGLFLLGEQQIRLSTRRKKGFVVIYMDIDNLKHINDEFGHSAGDEVLIEFAEILNDTFRKSDIKARIGGDEFVVIAIEARYGDGEALLTRLESKIEKHNAARKDREYNISSSTGFGYFDPLHPRTLKEIIDEADRDMYERKRKKKVKMVLVS